jgi:hypothetical protein
MPTQTSRLSSLEKTALAKLPEDVQQLVKAYGKCSLSVWRVYTNKGKEAAIRYAKDGVLE